MTYQTGMLDQRVTFAKLQPDTTTSFNKDGQPKYQIVGTFFAGETFNKGSKALREGAYDAYDVVMFRMRYNATIDRWCLLKYHGKWYKILSFNSQFRTNIIQITAQELSNQKVNIVDPEPTPTPTVDPEQQNEQEINDNNDESNS